MTPEKVKTGIAGAGYLGKFHARILTELPHSEPVGFVEPNDAIASDIEAKYGSLGLVRRRSIEELLSAGATAVIVATPTSTHFSVAQELLSGGADVMIEKPITVTLEEADGLVALARKSGRVLQVGHIERFNPAVEAVSPLITDVKFIEAHRLGVFVPRALDVDVVLDLLVHDLDIALAFVHKPVKEIRAVGVPILTGKVDIASVRIAFEGGCVANFTASRVSQEKTRKFRLFQPDWYLSLDTQNRDVRAFRLDRFTGVPRIVDWPVRVKPADPLTEEDRHFLDCCLTRKDPRVTGEDGRAALKLAHDILEEMNRS
ncbi:MAG: Gfo/Idh/MocA family oxidoreductase [Acidobacteria bacterium]|nr:Gfo/Idh/MocA family oxidoreductase [Acidobacteriota bacterium]MCG3194370.1 scyllo-inositol 2-dehydrogenase (NAD(+)) [Thermoanaerobaculia bacterium]MCK6682521.1 Gfo/Idh/MocA family oxidoreductase [Thermoanaerobaculia bacterium]